MMGSASSTSVDARLRMPSRQDFIFSTVIGEGGFSRVTSALHMESKRWLAMKSVPRKSFHENPKSIALVSNEIHVLKSLGDHPSVVSMHVSFSDENHLHMGFDLHAGGDLRYHLKADQFSERKAAFVVICLASALHHCHERGILHRDVKPENVILDAEGFPYLTDFGCSFMGRPASAENDDDLVCHFTSGTRQYLAPEVFSDSHRHGVEADFWSLGITLFEMMLARRPFAKHCPRPAIKLLDDLYKQQIFLSSTSLNQPHGLVRTRPTAKASKKTVMTPPIEVQQEMMCAADEDDDGFGSSAPAVMSTPPITPTNVSLMLPGADGGGGAQFEVPMIEPTRSDVVDSIIKHNRHLKKTFLLLETTAREELQATEAARRECGGAHGASPLSCLTRGGQLYTLFEVRSKLPASLRAHIPSSSRRDMSDKCLDLIEGLLDVRLWSRLGAGENYSALQNHPWFCSSGVGLGSWDQVLERRLVSPISPRDTAVREHIFEKFRHLQEEEEAVTTDPDESDECAHELSSEDTHLLLSCQYLAPKFAASFASPSEHKPSRRESFKCTKHSLDSIDTFSSMGIGDCESAYEGVGV